jgi:hypothetical protein
MDSQNAEMLAEIELRTELFGKHPRLSDEVPRFTKPCLLRIRIGTVLGAAAPRTNDAGQARRGDPRNRASKSGASDCLEGLKTQRYRRRAGADECRLTR